MLSKLILSPILTRTFSHIKLICTLYIPYPNRKHVVEVLFQSNKIQLNSAELKKSALEKTYTDVNLKRGKYSKQNFVDINVDT